MRRLAISIRSPVCLLLICGAWKASAGILDAVQVRAKADAPLEADQAGYEVILIDTHSDTLLVGGDVVVPESFGKVDTATLTIIDPDGQHLSSAELAPGSPARKKAYFEFRLRCEYLKNSTVTLGHITPDGVDVALVHLGTFGVRDLKQKSGPPAVPKVRLALAEQGLFGEGRDNFTPTDKVPWEEGQFYGFRLYFRGDGRSLPLRVEQTLPSAPKTWGNAEALQHLTISEDGRTASATVTVPTATLLDEFRWRIAEGDPEGDYTIKIFVRDELVKTFVCHVQKPPAKPAGAEKTPEP